MSQSTVTAAWKSLPGIPLKDIYAAIQSSMKGTNVPFLFTTLWCSSCLHGWVGPYHIMERVSASLHAQGKLPGSSTQSWQQTVDSVRNGDAE